MNKKGLKFFRPCSIVYQYCALYKAPDLLSRDSGLGLYHRGRYSRAASKSKFDYFLPISQQVVSTDITKISAVAIFELPPLLIQKCNGTTAGLGYLEVLELSMQILILGQLASVRTVNSHWERRIQFLY
jgi:hypothetical protein